MLRSDSASPTRRPEPPRRSQQIDDLPLAVDVRCQPLGRPSEDRVIENLGARLELLQPAHEGAQPLQPPRPGVRIIAAMAVASRPVGHGFHRQRSAMAHGLNMTRAAAQGAGILATGEPQTAALGQVEIDARLDRGRRAHAALPGHGSITSASLRLSSLASIIVVFSER